MVELLVIGGGLLGREVALASRDRFETALTYNAHPLVIEGCKTYQMDITGNLDLIQSLRPDYIVLTSAMTNVDRCESDREGAWEVNALGPKKVALAAVEAGSRLIHVSTDYVFDGEMGMYREDDSTSPINHYGKSKLAGEQFVQEICPKSVIARTSVIHGWNSARPNFATWAMVEMGKGSRINIVTDQYNSPTLASSLAEMLLGIRDESGIFHACGRERISRYDFTVKVARTFGLDESLINPISSRQLSWKAKRPMDSSLDISKISRFVKPLSVEDGLRAMAEVVR
jgi:dTDP-4-dehydrorhamnose reductase